MVFQFIEDINKALEELSKSLSQGGYLCFAVFNKPWVRECISKRILFEPSSNNTLLIDFGQERKVRVFNRSAKEYDGILKTLGFSKILEAYPPFTQQYIEKYKPSLPTNIPEFMILGYKKESSS